MNLGRAQIEEAFDHMDVLRARSSAAEDWSIWPEGLTEDVEFHDVTYGEYRGRKAVTDFVVRVHALFPHLRDERDWSLIVPPNRAGAPKVSHVLSKRRFPHDRILRSSIQGQNRARPPLLSDLRSLLWPPHLCRQRSEID